MLRFTARVARRWVLATNSSSVVEKTRMPLTRDFSSSMSTTSATSPPRLETLGVVGLGLMGHGICQVAASAGPSVHSQVVAFEPQDEFLQRGKARIEASLAKLVAKEKLSQEEADATLGRIHFTTTMADLAKADMVVEAVIEDFDLKRSLWRDLSDTCQEPHVIFASNTSSLSISELAHCTNRAAQFVGLHFFNPVQVMKLVEVIRHEGTAPAVLEGALTWAQNLGKVAVQCGDTPGFIVNRLLVPALAQAMLLVDRNDASIRDIDLSLQLGAGHPMGPLHLADYIGLDTMLYILQGWIEKYPNEPAFVVPQCLADKVAAGHLGRKSGQGFYHWNGEKRGDAVE